MNLPLLKSAAEQAKTSSVELEVWQMEISPDDVLRLVEVAQRAESVIAFWNDVRPPSAISRVIKSLEKALEGIEP